MVVEPYAADDTASNLNPIGRMSYSFSTLLCVPNALSQPGGYSLGAQAGEAAIRQVVTDAGFTRFRPAAETRSTWYMRSGRRPLRRAHGATRRSPPAVTRRPLQQDAPGLQ